MEVNKVVGNAYKQAIKAQSNAYAPYSNFFVGAAIKLKGIEKVITGCNLENASYGATVCAERGAIQAANTEFGKPDIEFIVVVSNTEPAIGPCALCLQVISEFAQKDLPIYLANKNEIQKVITFGDLLSSPFSEIPKTI